MYSIVNIYPRGHETQRATVVSESVVVFTWIQDSESRLEVPTETICFTCREGFNFSGKKSSVFPLSRKENGYSDSDSHIPEPHQFLYTDAGQELGAAAASPQGS
jgi:hypothetical protein